MAAPAPSGRLSVATLATAWVLTLAFDTAWAIGLNTYDGKTGDTPPPPLPSDFGVSAVVATALIALTWAIWCFVARRRWKFWRVLFAGFAVRGGLPGALQMVSVTTFGPAPFPAGRIYLSDAIVFATSLISGIAVALVVRAMESSRESIEQAIGDPFD